MSHKMTGGDRVPIYRQGDVTLRPIKELPEDLKITDNMVLAIGEKTGHNHRLTGGQVLVFEKGENKFLEVLEETQLVHDQHRKFNIRAGLYEVLIARQYTPFEMKIDKQVRRTCE